MMFSILDSTGEVKKVITCPEEDVALNIPLGGSYVEGSPPNWNCYRVGNNWVDKPTKPSRFHSWDAINKQWEDPRALGELRVFKWEEIKTARSVAIAANLITPFGVIQHREEDQKNLDGAVLLMNNLVAMGNTTASVDWTMADNSVVTLTAAQMIQVGLLRGQRVQECHALARIKRSQIDAATTLAEINAINW